MFMHINYKPTLINPVHKWIHFKVAILTYKVLSTQQPAYPYNLISYQNYHQPGRLLRSSSQSLLHVPRIKTDFGRRAFSSAAPQIWSHIYLLLSESQHHLTPSNVISKLTTLPHHRLTSHHLATPPHLWFNFFSTLVHYQIFYITLHYLKYEFSKADDVRVNSTSTG